MDQKFRMSCWYPYQIKYVFHYSVSENLLGTFGGNKPVSFAIPKKIWNNNFHSSEVLLWQNITLIKQNRHINWKMSFKTLFQTLFNLWMEEMYDYPKENQVIKQSWVTSLWLVQVELPQLLRAWLHKSRLETCRQNTHLRQP